MALTNAEKRHQTSQMIAQYYPHSTPHAPEVLAILLFDLMEWADDRDVEFDAAMNAARIGYREYRSELSQQMDDT